MSETDLPMKATESVRVRFCLSLSISAHPTFGGADEAEHHQ